MDNEKRREILEEEAITRGLKLCAEKEQNPERPEHLPPLGSWPSSPHLFEKEHLWAIKSALTAGRPLLVRGEPGTGKSQLARGAAWLLKRGFISLVVHAGSESRDLQYHYDAVKRLGDAQLPQTQKNALEPENYLSPGLLWWAFDWESAQAQWNRAPFGDKPIPPQGWTPADGLVILIDEIDKAETELPNSLLETLGNGSFTIPYKTGKEAIGRAEHTPAPLVVITTNEERQLPPAFLRRCLVIRLALPEKEPDLVAWLMQRGEIHYKGRCSPKVMERAAELLCKDRREAEEKRLPPPGQAEYLDLLRSLSRLCSTEADQLETLNEISRFSLKKNE